MITLFELFFTPITLNPNPSFDIEYLYIKSLSLSTTCSSPFFDRYDINNDLYIADKLFIMCISTFLYKIFCFGNESIISI